MLAVGATDARKRQPVVRLNQPVGQQVDAEQVLRLRAQRQILQQHPAAPAAHLEDASAAQAGDAELLQRPDQRALALLYGKLVRRVEEGIQVLARQAGFPAAYSSRRRSRSGSSLMRRCPYRNLAGFVTPTVPEVN